MCFKYRYEMAMTTIAFEKQAQLSLWSWVERGLTITVSWCTVMVILVCNATELLVIGMTINCVHYYTLMVSLTTVPDPLLVTILR
jgi:hypothetical protein